MIVPYCSYRGFVSLVLVVIAGSCGGCCCGNSVCVFSLKNPVFVGECFCQVIDSGLANWVSSRLANSPHLPTNWGHIWKWYAWAGASSLRPARCYFNPACSSKGSCFSLASYEAGFSLLQHGLLIVCFGIFWKILAMPYLVWTFRYTSLACCE